MASKSAVFSGLRWYWKAYRVRKLHRKAEWTGRPSATQTLQDWVHRTNDFGVSGLKSRRSPGRSRSLTAAQAAELLALTVEGPDPERDRVALCGPTR